MELGVVDLKVCHIVDSFPSKDKIAEGCGPNWYYYSKLSMQRDIEVHIICGRDKKQAKEDEIEGIKVHRVSTARGHRSTLYGEFAKKAYNKVLEIKPDLVHGHNAYHIGIITEKRGLNVPIITHLHGSVDLELYTDKLPFDVDLVRALRDRVYGRWSVWRNKYVTKHSDFVIACDKYTAESVRRYFNGKRCEVVYNGVDPDYFRQVDSDIKEKLDADRLLLFVGRPTPWKGVQYLLHALKKVERDYPNSKCLLLGVKRGGYYKTYSDWLISMSNTLKLKSPVFSPPISYFELPKYYSAADCLVVPSYPDPSPKVVYEGQACRCPIVGSNGGGIPEIFGKESGLLFRPRDAEDLAEKISIVLEDTSNFKGGREVVMKRATWDKCVEGMIGCYHELTGA